MSNKTASKSLPGRNEVQEDLTWRLEDIFESDEAWEKEYKEIKQLTEKADEFKGTLGESADHLYKALAFQDEILERMGKVYTYSHMRYDQDTTNSHYQGLDDRAKSLYTQLGSKFAYFVPEILSIDENKLQSFLDEKEELQKYKHALEEITLQRPHVLSAEEEALLAQASEVFGAASNTFGMLNNADLEFPSMKDEEGEEVDITHGRLIRFLESSDRRVRKEAFEKVYETYGKFENTFASTLSGTVKKDNFIASVRKYDSARHAALSANNIPEQVYDNLVETVNKNLHLLQRYIKLRKKVLELDEVHMYDLYTPLGEGSKNEYRLR